MNLSKPPKPCPIAAARSPFGSPPPPGPITFQKSEWLRCPPPLLRMAVRVASGSFGSPRISSSMDAFCQSGVFSSAALRLFTYAAWCLPWWISIVFASTCGSSALKSYASGGSENGYIGPVPPVLRYRVSVDCAGI